jgi:carboxyl-terminal processing protease
MKRIYSKLSIFLLVLLVITGCTDYDDEIRVPVKQQVNDFVWRGLNQYYLWQMNVDDLADDRFATIAEKEAYLNGFNSQIELFNSLLYQRGVVDKFSVIYSDYTVLEQALTGTSKSNGVDYELRYMPGSATNVFGWVRYVLPNSDASTKNIKRGDIFYAVDGVQLTNSNYSSLLANDQYTLNLATINNGTITSNGASVSLTKTAFSENPVLLRNVIELEDKKVGYLMYNGFYIAYENQLNEVFSYFASQGITHLVLDLRYNSGGAVVTAARLASMITGQFQNQVFAKQQWNEKIMQIFESDNPERIINRFQTTLENNTPLTSLQLNKVYVLTSPRTASASELIINGLQPYINVVQIGEKTTGKNVGSVTLYDSPNFAKQHLNPSHKYAMQPITFKIVNKDGFGDYQNGIIPTIPFVEDLSDLGVLGAQEEPLLRTALDYISAGNRTPQRHVKVYDLVPDTSLKSQMYLESFPKQ